MTARILTAIAVMLMPCLTVAEVDLATLHGLGDVHQHRVQIEDPDQTYVVHVRLPETTPENGPVPTVYLLDGGINFPLLAAYYRYLSLAEDVPPMMVVGIGYGTTDWQAGNQRSRDYTAPAADRDFWGGARRFRETLREVIIPLVETRYAADPTRRILFGQSLGGQFVLDTALNEPDLFAGFIASNPALHRNLDHFLTTPAVQPTRPPAVYVSSAAQDAERFRDPALRWIQAARETTLPWRLQLETDLDENHFSAAPAAFRRGLLHYFRVTSASSRDDDQVAACAPPC